MPSKRVKESAGKRAGKTSRKVESAAVRDDRGKRLLDLVVMLLGARAPVPFREIKAQFKAYKTDNEEAGLRAFERDKAELLELGVPLRYVTPEDDDSLEDGGYVVDLRRYRLPEIHLTPEEVGALVLAGSVAQAAPGTPYAEVVGLALKKLAFDLPTAPDTPGAGAPASDAAREPVLLHFPQPSNAAELSERLSNLEQATRNRKRVTFRYVTASSGQLATRDVDPYGLVYRQGAWLVVGYCHLRKDVRTFRIDRMTDVVVAPKPKSPDFERPEDFDVRRYADRSPWTFESGPPVTVEIDVHAPASAAANDDFGEGATRQPLPSGGTRVRFACSNFDYLVSRVLGAKGAISVRGPAEVKALVQRELDQVTAKYRKERA